MSGAAEQPNEPGFSETPSVLDHTLTLSYEERIEAHQAALELTLELQQAGQQYYAEQS